MRTGPHLVKSVSGAGQGIQVLILLCYALRFAFSRPSGITNVRLERLDGAGQGR